MNYVEEQTNELEALGEIYYNEIKIISKKPPIAFTIKVNSNSSACDEPQACKSDEEDDSNSDDDEPNIDGSAAQQQNLSIELKFELPPEYPDKQPSIKVVSTQNLDEDDVEEVLGNLTRRAEESLGTVMVFTLVSDLVEWLINKTTREAIELDQERERKEKEADAEETKRFEGAIVTEQSFLAWKAKFDAEMLKAKLLEQKRQADQAGGHVRRLTGREMFESDTTLAESDLNFVEDLDENQIEALLQNIDEFDLGDEEEFELDDEDEEFVDESEDE